ncbi:hypothetical protein HOP50_02g10660 [Chloropicon primus]|uniref:Uncharacterized protein n=1 Tax=Chloropicon primus TaxID=1764295 RepID=A0A5B8MGT7_9CHLO|nr:hypothetical protein A3770_02p10800 [Chloropicon primus]UPQ97771.1 hypothetical protein HOP50_02g10660 [Chloropicon primus]|eukprot:QDZ18562.1 hypothetical protein A3770_02p10800 [Chloropicon primus]
MVSKEYSPLSTPRSRSVMALLEKSKHGKHRNGQRKVNAIVEENNALIRGILGLEDRDSGDEGGEATPTPSRGAGVDEVELLGEIKRLEEKLKEQTAENIGLEKKVSKISQDATYFRAQSDKLLSYLSEDELRVLRKHLFEVEVDRLGAEAETLNSKNKELCTKLEGFERDLEFFIEPRDKRQSREKWIRNITKAAEIDYERAVGSSGASTSEKGRGLGGHGTKGRGAESGCNFLLTPEKAARELMRLRKALDDMGKKVLVVENARDSAYLEVDYIDVKIKKVNDQANLAQEKLESIKTFQRKMEELTLVEHQDNILTNKRVSFAEFYKDKVKDYRDEFSSKIDTAVKEAKSFLSPLLFEPPQSREDPLGDKEEHGDGAAAEGEEETEPPSTEALGANSQKAEDVIPSPAPETPNPLKRLETGVESGAEAVEEEVVYSNNPKEGGAGEGERDPEAKTPLASTTSKLGAPAPDSTNTKLVFESATKYSEMGTQTPEAQLPASKLDFTPKNSSDEDEVARARLGPRKQTEAERIEERLFEIRKRKALAYRDLSTGTLRALAEEALEEKKLLKRLKKIKRKSRRRNP